MENNKWLALTKKMDRISEWTGRIFTYFVLPLTAIIVFEVISRYFFNAPTVWGFEVSISIYGAHFMLVAAYGLLYESHVRINVFSHRFSHKVQTILDLIGYFVMFFPCMIVILIYGVEFAVDSWKMLEKSWTAFGMPLYPIKTVIPVTAVLMIFQGASEVTKKIVYLYSNKEGSE